MQRQYVTVDVFTDTLFQGNPVAVVLDAQGLSAEQMQTIAIEFGYSETTFVLPPKNSENTAWVRIFTPSREIPFAGHPNIGTAFALATRAAQQHESVSEQLIFEEAAGLVHITLMKEGATVIGAELIPPEKLSRASQVPADRAAACLSLDVGDIQTDEHLPQIASVGLPFLIVELTSRETLRRCTPNLDAYKTLFPLDGASAIYAYTRDTAGDDCDLQARMFTSRMNEDPATGSATAATVAFLADLRGDDLTLRIRQGVDMGRASLLLARVATVDGVANVHIGGTCVSAMAGTFFV